MLHAAEVLPSNSRGSLQRQTNSLRDALGDSEPDNDMAQLPLQQVLPFLCRESEPFRQILSNVARRSGQRAAFNHRAPVCTRAAPKMR